MSFLSRVAELMVPVVAGSHERSSWEYPPLSEQLAAIRNSQAGLRPWRVAGIDEALGVPAILSAVGLISNTVGSMSLEAFRNGALLPAEQTPRIVQRPNPFGIPRDFFRDTAFYLATRGEAWWWIAARDPSDRSPLSLYPIRPWEIVVEPNQRNVLRPVVKWNNREIPLDDLRQITYLPGENGRGRGPLQLAGAATSVSVEADAWAANFYSGSIPSMVGTTEEDLDSTELELLDQQWAEKPNNLPRWLTNGMKLEEPPFNPQKAQLAEARQHQVGETARMFNMPGSLVEYNMPGASLRYQNDQQVWTDFQRRCLSPHYLEPIEQTMSDLLPRSTAARFNLDDLLRADLKTRAEAYEKLIPLGVFDLEAARKREGQQPGSVNYAPVLQATPQATPERLPFERSALDPRCEQCGGKLAEAWAPGTVITCRRCKRRNEFTLNERSEMMASAPAPQINVTPQITLAHPDGSPLEKVAERISEQTAAILELAASNQALAERPNPAPKIDVDVAPPPPAQVQTGSFVEAINELKAMMAAPRTRKVIRDEHDQIIGTTEEIA